MTVRSLGPYEQFHGYRLSQIVIPERHPGLVAAPYFDPNPKARGFFWIAESRVRMGPYQSVQAAVRAVVQHLNDWRDRNSR